jgi:hypothetical protein
MKLSTLCAAAVLALFASRASADIVIVTITGTTTYDPAGIFGPIGADVTAVFGFNTALGVTFHDALYTEVVVQGGTVHDVSSPSLGAAVISAARTITFRGAYQAVLAGFNNTPIGGTDSGSTQSAEDSESSYVESNLHSRTAILPASITTPFSYSCQDSGPSLDTCVGDGYYFGLPFTYHEHQITLRDFPAAVPTPIVGAGLPGMISVLTGVGLLCWRRKRKSAARA